MRIISISVVNVIFLFVFKIAISFGQNYVITKPQKGDGIYAILRRYKIPTTLLYIEKFSQLNASQLDNGQELQLNQYYKLPVYRQKYDGVSIRSTLAINDYSMAKRIQDYNEKVYRAGLKSAPYTRNRDLWIPYFLMTPQRTTSTDKVSIFGPRYKSVVKKDNKLEGYVYYLVSGHGGPDPGAIGKRGKYKLHEDEYAYDITLRLARRLMEHNAKVYIIVRDPNDGIRDELYLRGDRDEYYLGGATIVNERTARLAKRAAIINTLYKQNLNVAKHQNVIILHVDSRSNSKRIDIFYYYKQGHRSGQKLARSLYNMVKRKYSLNQPGRGYRGTIASRDLFMLRETKPTTVYIELGNIKNTRDQDRLIQENNRQAIANWLCEGLISARKN